MSNAVGQEIVISDQSAALALVANHFISEVEGEQSGQCQSALALILDKNKRYDPKGCANDLSLGLKELITQALQAAYLQGYAECNQSSAGSFHLDVDVPLPSITFAVKFNKAVKFALQTAYTLGRKYGKAGQKEICNAASHPS